MDRRKQLGVDQLSFHVSRDIKNLDFSWTTSTAPSKSTFHQATNSVYPYYPYSYHSNPFFQPIVPVTSRPPSCRRAGSSQLGSHPSSESGSPRTDREDRDEGAKQFWPPAPDLIGLCAETDGAFESLRLQDEASFAHLLAAKTSQLLERIETSKSAGGASAILSEESGISFHTRSRSLYSSTSRRDFTDSRRRIDAVAGMREREREGEGDWQESFEDGGDEGDRGDTEEEEPGDDEAGDYLIGM